MPPNNPMTEGEALAVLRELRELTWTCGMDSTHLVDHRETAALDAAIAALTAHTAASGGEVACHRWWRNGELVDSDWTNGPPSERQIEAQRQCRDIADWTVEYAYRAPPAAVPADALERLRNDMMDVASTCDDIGLLGAYVIGFSNRIAALIPKGAV